VIAVVQSGLADDGTPGQPEANLLAAQNELDELDLCP